MTDASLAQPIPRTGTHRKDPKKTVLAHISDLHFRAKTDWETGVWRALADDLEDHGVDAIVVSGDVVDRSLRDFVSFQSAAAFVRARKFLETLAQHLKLDPDEAVVVVPGNHDVRLKGFLLGHNRDLFYQTFARQFGARTLTDLGVTFYTFDSNHETWPFDLATGHVDVDTLVGFTKPDAPVAAKRPPRSNLDIAVLHHHPMPIAATEGLASITDVEQMLLLKNAGQFMTEMVKARIDLILHGHKHWPAFSRATFRVDGVEHTLAVLAAGSVAHSTPPTYNLITTDDAGEIRLERRTLNGASFDTHATFAIETYATARARRFEKLARAHGALIRVERYSRVDHILPGSGDDDNEEYFEKVVAFGDEPVPVIASTYQASYGYIGNRVFITEAPQRITWKRGEMRPDGVRKAESHFEPPITRTHPISYRRKGRHANAIYFSQKDRLEASRQISKTEAVGTATQHAYENLSLAAVFPEGHFPEEFWIQVTDVRTSAKNAPRVYAEERYLRHKLTVVRASRTVALSFERPLPMHEYRIVWSLPEQDPSDVRLTDAQSATAAALTKKFADPDPVSLQALLQQLMQKLAGFVSSNLILDLFRYDAEKGGLVVAASTRAWPSSPEWSPIPNGRGPIGRSFRRRSAICCVPAASGGLSWDPADELEPLPADTAAFLAMPVAYPINDGRKVGVLIVRTADALSQLTHIRTDRDLLTGIFAGSQRWFAGDFAKYLGLADFSKTLFSREPQRPPETTAVVEETELSEATSSFKLVFVG